MLEKYKDTQNICYTILTKSLKNDRCSHAYLFEINGNNEAMSFIKDFVKELICPYNHEENTECSVCNSINNNTYSELLVIEPDGLWIKKEQLLMLQEEFSTKATIGKRKVYVIKYAENLNSASANTILKFLEAPEDNIIAVLLTNNIGQVLETIVSRCQIMSFLPNKPQDYLDKYKEYPNKTMILLSLIYCETKEQVDDFLINSKIKDNVEKVLTFIDRYETLKMETIVYTKELWHNNFVMKEDNIFAFDIMINFYMDVINNKNGKELKYFISYKEQIEKVSSQNSIYDIINKIDLLTQFRELIKYNANINLLIDKLIIKLESGDNNV